LFPNKSIGKTNNNLNLKNRKSIKNQVKHSLVTLESRSRYVEINRSSAERTNNKIFNPQEKKENLDLHEKKL
jgi:hypothetical protein